jgi:hypothetical protein
VWWALLLGTSVWANRPPAPAPTPLDIEGVERDWDVDVKEEHNTEQELQAVQTRAGDREQKAAAVTEFHAREGAVNVLVDSTSRSGGTRALKNILTEYRIGNLYSQLSALGAHYPDDLVDMDDESIGKLQAKPLEIIRLNRLLAKLKPVDAAVEAPSPRAPKPRAIVVVGGVPEDNGSSGDKEPEEKDGAGGGGGGAAPQRIFVFYSGNPYMFAPIVKTVVAGFRAREQELGLGYEVYNFASQRGADHKIYPDPMSSLMSPASPVANYSQFIEARGPTIHDVKTWNTAVARMNAGDVVFWLGVIGKEGFEEACRGGGALADRAVYCVYYNSEPSTIGPDGAQEYWDYSKFNQNRESTVRNFKKSKQVVTRWVPPGHQSDLEAPPLEQRPFTQQQAIYMGTHEGQCAAMRNTSAHPLLRELTNTNGVWKDSTFVSKVLNKTTILVNMHQFCCEEECTKQQPLEAFRFSLYLSGGALLVSPHCAEADEAGYEGIVLFEDGFYEASSEATATGWSPALQRLLDSPAARAKWVKSSLALYRERFSPQGIFERAGVYSDMLRRAKAQRGPGGD